MREDLVLPSGSRLIHIGPQKTGTTAIQSALHEVRKQVAAHGVYVPRGGWRRREAGWALGLGNPWAGTDRPGSGVWAALADEVLAAGEARVCVSNEDFCHADTETIKRIVDDLGGERVHVVAVARALHRYLPSQWQERVKAGQRRSFDNWLKVILHGDDSSAEWRNVWRGHDTASLVRRWLTVVPPEAFTLVILDDDDRRQLPAVFEQMLGLPEGFLVPRTGRNASLSYAETEVIRHLNRTAAVRGLSKSDRAALIRHGLVVHLKRRSKPAPGPRGPTIPQWAMSVIEGRTEERIHDIAGLPVRVVGDPAHLRGSALPEDRGERAPKTVPVTWAAEAIASVVEAAVRQGSADSGNDASPAPARDADGPRTRWSRLRSR